jgi:phosphate starvation-inducible PhoH-like protein
MLMISKAHLGRGVVANAAGTKAPKVSDFQLHHLEKTPNHISYVKHLKDDNVPMVVGIGPAGTGKTLLASAHAITRLINRDIKRVIITRPAVSMDETHGYLPGDLEKKMMPWLIPIYDCFKEYITANRLREYITNEEIEICPLSYIRGRTFHDSWVIADEVQNSTINQMKTLLTRTGHNSKLILTGDLAQCDIHGTNGLEDFLRRFTYYKQDHDEESQVANNIQIVTFDEEDIMRSDIVKYVLEIYKY